MPMVNLTPGPLTFMRSGGRQHGDEPGSEFITLPPSGRVAVVVVHTTLIPVVEHEPIGSVFVDIHEIDGVPEVRNLPTDPGHYIVSAQVIDALGPEQVEQCRGRGIRLYTPASWSSRATRRTREPRCSPAPTPRPDPPGVALPWCGPARGTTVASPSPVRPGRWARRTSRSARHDLVLGASHGRPGRAER